MSTREQRSFLNYLFICYDTNISAPLVLFSLEKKKGRVGDKFVTTFKECAPWHKSNKVLPRHVNNKLRL